MGCRCEVVEVQLPLFGYSASKRQSELSRSGKRVGMVLAERRDKGRGVVVCDDVGGGRDTWQRGLTRQNTKLGGEKE